MTQVVISVWALYHCDVQWLKNTAWQLLRTSRGSGSWVPGYAVGKSCPQWTQTLLPVFPNNMASSLFPPKWLLPRLVSCLGWTPLFQVLISLPAECLPPSLLLFAQRLCLPPSVLLGLSYQTAHFLFLPVIGCHFLGNWANINSLPPPKGRRSCVSFHLSESRHTWFLVPVFSFPSSLVWLLSHCHRKKKEEKKSKKEN